MSSELLAGRAVEAIMINQTYRDGIMQSETLPLMDAKRLNFSHREVVM
jgi:hypothetical protein